MIICQEGQREQGIFCKNSETLTIFLIITVMTADYESRRGSSAFRRTPEDAKKLP
jgi:hypothetical protein